MVILVGEELNINDKIVRLSISQWHPCPLAIWNLVDLRQHAPIIIILHCTVGRTMGKNKNRELTERQT